LYDVFCRTSSYQSYISLLSDDDDDNLEDNDDDLQAALQARLAEARYCFSVYVHPFFTFGTRPPFCSPNFKLLGTGRKNLVQMGPLRVILNANQLIINHTVQVANGFGLD